MSQTLVLCRLSAIDFAAVQQENSWQVMYQLAIEQLGLDSSFMAIEYLLQLAGLSAELASAAVYPPHVLAPDEAFEAGDYEDPDALLAHFEARLTYATPATCQQVWWHLQQVTAEDISRLYNARKLNADGIYPNCWHDDESENLAFNRRYVVEHYALLRDFYKAAATAGEYVLSAGEG